MDKVSGRSNLVKNEQPRLDKWITCLGLSIVGAYIGLVLASGRKFSRFFGIIMGAAVAVIAVCWLWYFVRILIDAHSPDGTRFLLKKLAETKQPQEYIEAMRGKMQKAQEKGKDFSVYAMNTAYGLICNGEFENAEALLSSLDISGMTDNFKFVCQQHKVSIGIYEEDYEKAGGYLPDLLGYLDNLKIKGTMKEELGRLTMFWEALCAGQYGEAFAKLEEIECSNTQMDISYIWMYRMQLAFRMGDDEQGREMFRRIQERKNYPMFDKILERYRER